MLCLDGGEGERSRERRGWVDYGISSTVTLNESCLSVILSGSVKDLSRLRRKDTPNSHF